MAVTDTRNDFVSTMQRLHAMEYIGDVCSVNNGQNYYHKCANRVIQRGPYQGVELCKRIYELSMPRAGYHTSKTPVMGIDKKDTYGETPLSYACREGNWPVVEWLLERGANPDNNSNEGWRPAHYAIRDWDKPKTRGGLIGTRNNFAEPHNIDEESKEKLNKAKIRCLKLLVRAGADSKYRHGRMTTYDVYAGRNATIDMQQVVRKWSSGDLQMQMNGNTSDNDLQSVVSRFSNTNKSGIAASSMVSAQSKHLSAMNLNLNQNRGEYPSNFPQEGDMIGKEAIGKLSKDLGFDEDEEEMPELSGKLHRRADYIRESRRYMNHQLDEALPLCKLQYPHHTYLVYYALPCDAEPQRKPLKSLTDLEEEFIEDHGQIMHQKLVEEMYFSEDIPDGDSDYEDFYTKKRKQVPEPRKLTPKSPEVAELKPSRQTVCRSVGLSADVSARKATIKYITDEAKPEARTLKLVCWDGKQIEQCGFLFVKTNIPLPRVKGTKMTDKLDYKAITSCQANQDCSMQNFCATNIATMAHVMKKDNQGYNSKNGNFSSRETSKTTKFVVGGGAKNIEINKRLLGAISETNQSSSSSGNSGWWNSLSNPFGGKNSNSNSNGNSNSTVNTAYERSHDRAFCYYGNHSIGAGEYERTSLSYLTRELCLQEPAKYDPKKHKEDQQHNKTKDKLRVRSAVTGFEYMVRFKHANDPDPKKRPNDKQKRQPFVYCQLHDNYYNPKCEHIFEAGVITSDALYKEPEEERDTPYVQNHAHISIESFLDEKNKNRSPKPSNYCDKIDDDVFKTEDYFTYNSYPADLPDLEISHLKVARAHAKRGLGALLFLGAARHVQRQYGHLKHIECALLSNWSLSVFEANVPAQKLYVKMGMIKMDPHRSELFTTPKPRPNSRDEDKEWAITLTTNRGAMSSSHLSSLQQRMNKEKKSFYPLKVGWDRFRRRRRFNKHDAEELFNTIALNLPESSDKAGLQPEAANRRNRIMPSGMASNGFNSNANGNMDGERAKKRQKLGD